MSTLIAQKVKHASAVVDNITLGSDGKATLGGQLDLGTIGQIKFPAAQNASADANTLDDYEEGTWTPAIVSSSGSTTGYTLRAGKYTKIGRQVIANFSITLSATTSTGQIYISGLPFVVVDSTQFESGGGFISYMENVGTTYGIFIAALPTDTKTKLYSRTSATGNNDPSISNTTRIDAVIAYITNT